MGSQSNSGAEGMRPVEPELVGVIGGCDDVDGHLIDPNDLGRDSDPIVIRGQQLAYWIIEHLVNHQKVPSDQRDLVFQTLCACVKDILQKHTILFNGMANRIEVHHYHEFTCVANELFEANSNDESSQLRITWGRVIALFAFAVRLSEECGQNRSRVTAITGFLASYITKHVIEFVQENGGWMGLVEQFPGPERSEDVTLRRAILWSGLCVGLAATMYISSLLR